jgi:hypothetical protein
VTFVVLYDASVLYPNTLRDLLIRIAQAGMVQAKVIDRMRATEVNGRWPRRVASAQLDLALALLAADKLDEACAHAQGALESGRVVPSNHWRALEVVAAPETRGLPEARDLREMYEAMRRAQA